jgi:hypothetical protein
METTDEPNDKSLEEMIVEALRNMILSGEVLVEIRDGEPYFKLNDLQEDSGVALSTPGA